MDNSNNFQSVSDIGLDFGDMTSHMDLVLHAATTEDELGGVLRLHLLTEQLLWAFYRFVVKAPLAEYIREPREFGLLLSYCVALGMPTKFAAVAKQLNNMRNGLAHLKQKKLDKGNVEQFARLVADLTGTSPTSDEFKSHGVEVRVSVESEEFRKLKYKEGSLKDDVIVCVGYFISVYLRWLIDHAVSYKYGRPVATES
ncbi:MULTISPECIES: hypothetical protein [Pandoraea]|uniref:hypothetical protein n=1 Tax=Pandoraea TaxID=93217 RepID=UPI001F5D8C13|nr:MULTISPECIES: hypothetical protein [Pandoraea]